MNVFALLLTFRHRYQLFYALLCIECFSNLYFYDLQYAFDRAIPYTCRTCINFVNLVLPDLVTFHSRSSTVVLVALRVEGRDFLCV